MPKFIHQPIDASAGDVITATAYGFYVSTASMCLETISQSKQNQAANDEQENPVFGFEVPGTVTKERPSIRFTIPKDDTWCIFYDADQIRRVDVTIERPRQA